MGEGEGKQGSGFGTQPSTESESRSLLPPSRLFLGLHTATHHARIYRATYLQRAAMHNKCFKTTSKSEPIWGSTSTVSQVP